jgi:urease accessory protein
MDWLVWQLVDSALPTGSFAHSLGLEAAWQQGGVDAASLPRFVRDVLAHAGRSALPFVTAGHRTPDGPGKNDTIDAIDARCDAFLTGVVANRASRTQGRAWLATMERAFPRPPVQALCRQVRSGSLARHYAPLFGATLRALEVDRPTTQRMFLYTTCRSTLSAAVRLGVIGTTDAQRLIARSAGDLERTFDRCSTLGVDDAAQTAPLIDLWQSAHDRLYSRLFQS